MIYIKESDHCCSGSTFITIEKDLMSGKAFKLLSSLIKYSRKKISSGEGLIRSGTRVKERP